MELEKFFKLFLKGTAKITLASNDYGIYYSGLLKNLPIYLSHGEVESIEGLGSEDDIIITVRNWKGKRI